MAVPFAIGDPRPAWPLPGVFSPMNASRSFGAPRGSGKLHAGVDLVAPEGSLVVAMEPGRIVRIVRGWDNVYDQGKLVAGDTARVLVEGDSGLVLNYAAVGIDSWEEFGRKVGDRVDRGAPLARVGRYPGGGTMLHLEAYRSGTRDNAKWYADQAPPPSLLDPTYYLAASSSSSSDEPEPTPRPLPRPSPSPSPSPRPTPTPEPPRAGGIGVGVLLTAIVLGLLRGGPSSGEAT